MKLTYCLKMITDPNTLCSMNCSYDDRIMTKDKLGLRVYYAIKLHSGLWSIAVTWSKVVKPRMSHLTS